MKRLIVKAFDINDSVKYNGSVYTVVQKNEDGTYLIENENGQVNNVNYKSIKKHNIFNVGDKVYFHRNPLEKDKLFTIKEVLDNGNYFIECEDGDVYTNVNGINLKKENEFQ